MFSLSSAFSPFIFSIFILLALSLNHAYMCVYLLIFFLRVLACCENFELFLSLLQVELLPISSFPKFTLFCRFVFLKIIKDTFTIKNR